MLFYLTFGPYVSINIFLFFLKKKKKNSNKYIYIYIYFFFLKNIIVINCLKYLNLFGWVFLERNVGFFFLGVEDINFP